MNRRQFLHAGGGLGAAGMVEILGISGLAFEKPERLRTSVREYNGSPRLFINGRPDAGMAFSHNGFYRTDRHRNAYRDFQKFSEAGIHQFRMLGLITPREDGSLDTEAFELQMNRLLNIDPDILLMMRLLRHPPTWWLDAHPGELMVHLDAATGKPVNIEPHKRRPSFASRKYRRDMAGWMNSMVRYCEERYAQNIMAYFYHGGVIEWAYSWDELLSDYSRVQRDGFREWLRDRYKDNQTLRSAWNDPRASFDAVEIPRNRTRARGEPALFNPAKNRNVIDYLTYHSEVVAGSCVEVAGRIKETLADVGAEKIVGTWYGFDFWPATHPAHVHNSGHHAFDKVLKSPDIDFLGLIHSHHERVPGGIWLQHYAAGSVSLHGKLSWEEEDTATYMTEDELSWQQKCPTLRQSIGVLTRNFAGTLSVGGAEYWHDFSGEHWFGSDELVRQIANFAVLARKDMKKPFRSGSQIAVFTSKESIRYIRQDRPLTDALFSRQISELSHLGAPIDIFYLEDIPLLARKGRLEQYSMAVFMNALKVGEKVHAAIREQLARDNRTLVWLYAVDCMTQSGLSAGPMQKITGLPVEIRDQPQPLKAISHLTGTLVQYGTDSPLRPVFAGKVPPDDEKTEILGWYLQPAYPALLRRKLDGWTSVWSGAPALPAVVLRQIAREAGVHIYAGSGEQVFAWNDLLALHASFSGQRKVVLPRPAAVYDAFSGEAAADAGAEFTLDLRRADTAVLRIDFEES